MTDAQQAVLFYVFIGFFVLIGLGSLAVLLGWIKSADKAFRKWAVGGFIGAVTAAVVGLFQVSTKPPSSFITVALLPPSEVPAVAASLVLGKGSFEYDDEASGKVSTHRGDIVAANGTGSGWLVRLPAEVADKLVTLSFPDQSNKWWQAGPFYPNVIQQTLGEKVASRQELALRPVALAIAAPVVGWFVPPQQQATTKFNNYARPSGSQGGQTYYEWRVFVDEPPEVLKTIQQVDYQLHPTFPNPFRTSRDRAKNFELVTSGWGAFRILITVHYTNGSQAKTSYMLDLSKPWPKLVQGP